MDLLLQLPGTVHVPIFHLYDDEKRQPARCELVVAPALGWAVATQLNDGGPGLVLCHQTLAVKVCQLYPIEPGNLVLFTRYSDGTSFQNLYVLHFASGGRDLFHEISFAVASRRAVPEVDTPALIEQLQAGMALPPEWRALQAIAGK